MKKNFFFLKSLIALFVVALFSANAYAEDVWKRVTIASELKATDYITFVKENNDKPANGGYIYAGFETTATAYTGLPKFEGTGFTLKASAIDGFWLLEKDGQQLRQNGALINLGDVPETQWSFEFEGGENSLAKMESANKGNYFVWNENAKFFYSSTSAGKVAIYKKVDAAAPTYNPATGTALRVKLMDAKKTINVNTTTDGAKVWYKVGSATTFTEGFKSSDVDILGGTVNADFDKKENINVEAYTVIGYGQTSKTSATYSIYRLDDAKMSYDNNARVGKDGILYVNAAAYGATSCTMTVVAINDQPANEPLVIVGTAANAKADVAKYCGKNITVKAVFTRSELPNEKAEEELNFTVKKYSDAEITLTADPEATSKISAGQIITIKAALSEKAADYVWSNDPAVTTLTWENTATKKTIQSAVKLNGANVQTKVPADVRGDGATANWTLKVPAGLFIADTQASPATVNKITSAEASYSYAPDYAKVAFTIDPEQKEFVTDGTSNITFNVTVYPSGANKGVETITVPAESIKVTDSQNKDLSGSVTIEDNGNGKYAVTFPVTTIKDYISNSTNKIDLMFSIKEGAIKCTSDVSKVGVDYTTNNADVVSYVRFYESVDITLGDIQVTPNPFCTKEPPVVKFSITAKGKANDKNIYTVSLAANAKAAILGTDAYGKSVNKDATITVKDNVATVALPADMNGRNDENYSVIILDKAFYVQTGTLADSRSFSGLKIYDKVLDARAHSTFSASTTVTKYAPTKNFTVDVKATPQNGTIIDGLKYVKSLTETDKTVTVGSIKGYVSNIQAIYGGLQVTITTDEILTPGTHTVTFADDVFTVDCDKNKSLTTNVVIEEVVWSLDKTVYSINDEQTTFDVNIKATFDGKAENISYAPATIKGKLNAADVTLSKKAVNSDKTVTYTVTTDKLAAAGNDSKTYDFSIAKEQLTAKLRKNNDLTAKVSVYSYVKYALVTDNVTDIDTKTKNYTFEIKLTDKNGVVLTRDLLEDRSEKDAAKKTAENSIAFNSGFNSNYPTTEFVTDGKGGTQKKFIKTTFENLKQGQYQFNIPVGTLYADANVNSNKMYVNFSVKNHIALSWAEDITKNVDVLGDIAEDKLSYVGTAQNIDTNTKTITVKVKGWDAEDGVDATNLINLDGKFQLDSADVVATKTANAGEYTITLPTDLKAGTHKLTLAEKALKANNSTNKAMTMDVVVLDAVIFAAQDVTTSYQATTFKVKVTDTDAPVKVVIAEGATVDGDAVALSECADKGYVTVTCNPLAQGKFQVKIPATMLKVNNTVQASKLTCYVTVNRNFVIVDNDKYGFTKKSDVNEAKYDTVTYKRNFTGNWETLAVPFAITPEQAAANGWEIYRINTVAYDVVDSSTGDKKNSVFVTKVENTTTPNMPYLIKGNASKSEYVFTKIQVEQPASKTLEFNSTSRKFTVTSVAGDAKQEGLHDIYFCKNGGFLRYAYKTEDATVNIYPYRWYLKVGAETLYSDEMHNEFDIEIGDGSSTGIENVNADEDEAIFNLSGQKMNSIQKGLNIVNGRKFIVK